VITHPETFFNQIIAPVASLKPGLITFRLIPFASRLARMKKCSLSYKFTRSLIAKK